MTGTVNRGYPAGEQFGFLTVRRQLRHAKNGKAMWFCSCVCGNTGTFDAHRVKTGKCRSCGCMKRQLIGKSRRTHGESSTPEYRAWYYMLKRCYDPRNPAYANYGGRGIRVCDQWRQRKGLQKFLQDMGRRPSVKHTLERLDNEGDYSPKNCGWRTRAEQARNRRTTWLLTLGDRTQCLKDWAKEYGVPPTTVAYRLRRGKTLTEALRAAY